MRQRLATSRIYATNNNLRIVEFRSDYTTSINELIGDYCLLLDYNIIVRKYLCCPKIYQNGELISIPGSPDLLLQESFLGDTLKLVYYSSEENSIASEKRAIEKFCLEHNMIYVILQKFEILKRNVEISNWKFLLSETKLYDENNAYDDMMLINLINLIIATEGPKKIDHLTKKIARSYSPDHVRRCIHFLLRERTLCYNYKERISEESLIWLQ